MTTPDELTPTSVMEREFEERGFRHNLGFDDGLVVDLDSGASWDPALVRVVHEHRAEGTTDPADESVLLALLAPDGTRGTIVATYGPDAEHADELRTLGTAVED